MSLEFLARRARLLLSNICRKLPACLMTASSTSELLAPGCWQRDAEKHMIHSYELVMIQFRNILESYKGGKKVGNSI